MANRNQIVANLVRTAEHKIAADPAMDLEILTNNALTNLSGGAPQKALQHLNDLNTTLQGVQDPALKAKYQKVLDTYHKPTEDNAKGGSFPSQLFQTEQAPKAPKAPKRQKVTPPLYD